jgi:N-acyl-D-aspartate/D-glutamate deacylase
MIDLSRLKRKGKTLSEIARSKGMDPYDVLFGLLVKEKGAVNMCAFVMNEDVISAMIKKTHLV